MAGFFNLYSKHQKRAQKSNEAIFSFLFFSLLQENASDLSIFIMLYCILFYSPAVKISISNLRVLRFATNLFIFFKENSFILLTENQLSYCFAKKQTNAVAT